VPGTEGHATASGDLSLTHPTKQRAWTPPKHPPTSPNTTKKKSPHHPRLTPKMSMRIQTCRSHPLNDADDEPTTSARRHPGLSSTTTRRTQDQAPGRTQGDRHMVHDHPPGHPVQDQDLASPGTGPAPRLAWLTRPGQPSTRPQRQRKRKGLPPAVSALQAKGGP